MNHKDAIATGVELLKLCQRLQSENDKVVRPAPGEINKAKTLDQFSQDIDRSISYMTKLYALMPMQDQLADLGRKLEREGKITVLAGYDYARAGLSFILKENGIHE